MPQRRFRVKGAVGGGLTLDRRRYATGKKVTDKEFSELKIEPNTFHGDWNYVTRPRTD